MKFPLVLASFKMFWWITKEGWFWCNILDLLRVVAERGVYWASLMKDASCWGTMGLSGFLLGAGSGERAFFFGGASFLLLSWVVFMSVCFIRSNDELCF